MDPDEHGDEDGATAVVVGHVTDDWLADGRHPGGAVLHAGVALHALGARVHAVTAAAPDAAGMRVLSGFARAEVAPSPTTCTFDERYLDGARTARLLSRAVPLRPRPLDGDLLLLGPVAGELEDPRAWVGRTRLQAAALQGWLRRFDAAGRMVAARLSESGLSPDAFAGFDVVSCSAEDLAADPELEAALAGRVGVLAVTLGRAGARLHAEGRTWTVPPVPAVERDPTGAGDVFAAVLAWRLLHGARPEDAARDAAHAGARAVEAAGLEGARQAGARVRAMRAGEHAVGEQPGEH